jgi:hypothetical protein
VSSLDAFNALSLCNIGPVSFHFLLDFWHRNAKAHLNRLCFIRCFTNVRFWPAGFALWHRLSKMRPPCGVSGNAASNPSLPPSPRSPVLSYRPDSSATPKSLSPPTSPCRSLRRSVPVTRPCSAVARPLRVLLGLHHGVASIPQRRPGNASEASPHPVLSRHTGMSVSYFCLSVDLMQSYVR